MRPWPGRCPDEVLRGEPIDRQSVALELETQHRGCRLRPDRSLEARGPVAVGSADLDDLCGLDGLALEGQHRQLSEPRRVRRPGERIGSQVAIVGEQGRVVARQHVEEVAVEAPEPGCARDRHRGGVETSAASEDVPR